MADAIDYLLVAILGAAVGGAELVSRYRDAPYIALRTRPAWLYLSLNVAAAALALMLVGAYGWTFGASGVSLRWTQVLLSGIGAMALFRTSLFTVRAGDRDVGIGPGSFLQTLRDAADREVDRVRAHSRSASVARLMQGLDFQRAARMLVPYCLALMQNVSPAEQKAVLDAVRELTADPMEDAIKVRVLGLHLLNVVGPAVLSASVEALRSELTEIVAAPAPGPK
ncbi:MAG TPA: hypothetical protein VMR62_21225 [Bryobacteraceae bacterium]|nr:hypothetical protein [Bryobacteraceae bacterium]